MKFGRKIVYILSLVFVMAGGIWGGFYHGTAQYYVMEIVSGIGTAAYQALIQLTVCFVVLSGRKIGLTVADFRYVLRS